MTAYQCCYTNLLRYDGPYKVGGWTVTAFSRDIPPEALRDCEQFQRADAADDCPTNEFGKPLRLYETLRAGNFAYVIRTRYGMRDHMGRRNNLFSHAYILPLDEFVARPELLCGLDASAFVQDAPAAVEPETESAELARLALQRLHEGRLPSLPRGDIPDFPSALRGSGLAANRDAYKTLLQCVYAHMDAQREQGQRPPPLYVQYEPRDNPDKTFRQILCALLCGLPYWMRRQIRVSNWADLDNTPKDLIFTTEDVTRLSGPGGAYLVISTGARNVERRRMARLERCGYLPYAALTLPPESFSAFFAGLDQYAKALGDTDATSQAVRKLVWQCYWNPVSLSFAERPDVSKLDRKELISLLSDAADSGLYSMSMREIIAAARKRVSLDTLTQSLRTSLESWDAEYRQRHDMPQKATEESDVALIRRCAPPSSVDGGRPMTVGAIIENQSFGEEESNPALIRPDASASPLEEEANDSPLEEKSNFALIRRCAPPSPVDGGRPMTVGAIIENQSFGEEESNPALIRPDASASPLEEESNFALIRRCAPPSPVDGGRPMTVGAIIENQSFGNEENVETPSESSENLETPSLLPVIDWDAVQLDWLQSSGQRRETALEWLGELLNVPQTVPVAESAFRRQAVSMPQRDFLLYLLLMMDRKVSGKLNPRAVVRAYCFEELARARVQAVPLRWNALAFAASVNARMSADDLSEQVRHDALELYQNELSPCDSQGRAVLLLRMYEELLRRLDPADAQNAWGREQYDARKFYWNRVDGNWKYFSFDALDEYDAFDDGRPHAFPNLIRLANRFRVANAREFLKQLRMFFETCDTPDYYTDENRLRITAALFDELQRRRPDNLPDDYRGWLNLVTVAEEKNSVPAVQELFDAIHPFDPWKLADAYPRFLWKCRDGGDRKAREAAYPLVRDACLQYDPVFPVPLDLWLTLGGEAVSFYELFNRFAIFEKCPAASVLRLPPADAVRDSSLITSPNVRDDANAYLKYRLDPRLRQTLRGWLQLSDYRRGR